jgi:3'-5' exoribonuclease
MKEHFAGTLKEGERIDAAFALRGKELRSTRTREAYLSMELSDRTGRIPAVMFRPDRGAESVPSGTVVQVRGVVTAYRGVLRISVDSLRPAAAYDASDIMPASRRDTVELVSELRVLVRGVQNPHLARLLRQIFGDKRFMARFCACPAAQTFHHAYLGGLLEHTVSVTTTCRSLAALYPDLDADLLVTGALLHDIGKVDEMSFDTSIDTNSGRLLGHVILGERRLSRAIEGLAGGMPSELAMMLSHVIISHHGELEWGAPKRPSTLEALLLHHADNLDAKAAGFIEASRAAAIVDESWTDAMNLFRRPLYAPRPVEDDRPAPIAEEAHCLLKGA